MVLIEVSRRRVVDADPDGRIRVDHPESDGCSDDKLSSSHRSPKGAQTNELYFGVYYVVKDVLPR